MNEVYVLRYSLSCGTELVSCYHSMQGVINRLEMMKLHDSLIEDESVHIEKMEVIDDEESERRLNTVKSYKLSK